MNTQNRSYGCSRGCGNPYDFIIVTVSEAFSEMLCLPCFVATSMDMIRAVTEPGNPDVMAAVAAMPASDQVPMADPVTRARGHHAPAESDDPTMLEAFDGVVTEDELPEAFR